MFKLFWIVVACLAVTACSSPYATNGEQLYLQSRNGANLVVPPPLSSKQLSHFYDLPLQSQDAKIGIEPPQD